MTVSPTARYLHRCAALYEQCAEINGMVPRSHGLWLARCVPPSAGEEERGGRGRETGGGSRGEVGKEEDMGTGRGRDATQCSCRPVAELLPQAV